MKPSLFAFFGFILAVNSIAAGNEPKYPVDAIATELMENANAVVRVDEGFFTVKGIDKAMYTKTMAVTILNKKANDMAYLVVMYNDLTKVSDITAAVYDKNGEQIRKLKKSEILDRSYIDGSNVYDDSRLKIADLSQNDFPYTVEYSYTIDYNFLYSIPNWAVIPDENVSVEYSRFSITSPISLKLRYKMLNFEKDPKELLNNDQVTHEWEFFNQIAKEYEPMGRGFRDYNPQILVSPAVFMYEGYQGDMSSWDSYAKWIHMLNEGREEISAETQAQIKSLVKNIKTNKEKIEAIYKYMQSRTRYVSIQLGIGGLQPFPASVVDEKGYGDCKALSTYTKALLAAADINAHYVWIYGGAYPQTLHSDFPDHYFNHVILSVPNQGDTVWLECTSQTNPAGYLGSFTGDRDAFIITEDGGRIVHTPAYDYDKNRIFAYGVVELDKEGNATAEVKTQFIGKASEYNGLSSYLKHTEKDQKDWLKSYIDIPNYNLITYKFNEQLTELPETTLDLHLHLPKIASVSGKRLFLQPSLLNRLNLVPHKVEKRESPVYISASKIWEDSIQYNIPANFHIEHVPEPVLIESNFGKYEASFLKNEKGFLYIRKFTTHKGKYLSAEYDQLINFYKQIKRADSKKIVLMGST